MPLLPPIVWLPCGVQAHSNNIKEQQCERHKLHPGAQQPDRGVQILAETFEGFEKARSFSSATYQQQL
jgi:hypothetical protein